MIFRWKGRRYRSVDRFLLFVIANGCVLCGFGNKCSVAVADLVVLADFNTTAQTSEMATARDFADLGVEGLSGEEQVLSIIGRDGTNFSAASYSGPGQTGGVFQFQTDEDAILSSWRSASSASFRTFSLTEQQETSRLSSSAEADASAGSAVLRDFIHLTRNNENEKQSRRIKLSHLGLQASKSYELYLFGNLGMGRDQDDEFWTESRFQGLSSEKVRFASDEVFSGSFRVRFETSADFVDGEDNLEFLWELNDQAAFGTFNGFAITETTAVPEPSIACVMMSVFGSVFVFRREPKRR